MEPQSNQKIYYAIAGVVILVAAFLFLSNSRKEEVAETNVAPTQKMPVPGMGDLPPVMEKIVTEIQPTTVVSTPVITFTDAGFSPATLEVAVDTKVRFVNNSKGDMWVASAMHPTHQVLPGFDQLKGGKPGTSYEYTFVKAGTWKFHDHLKPEFKGSVTVK